ncbi:RiPP maturation radical SAM C-methyltransferase [Streptomyces sp. NPDC005760]|uniref:RiPP maturation radical SAM C-methyltransferase n=1 Tax=Streptomyces sp. NPDC005760 TaxID=3156718 RepID=UPI0033D822B7
MRIHLVAMPWQAFDTPSIQVGLLRALLARTRPDDEVSEYHGSVRWADFLLTRSAGRIRPADCLAVSTDTVFDGLGDWVFSGVLYGDADWGLERLRAYADKHGTDIDLPVAMRPYAEEFVDIAARTILATEPDVVGMTTTFMQNVPSLALARELKRRRPGLVIVLGGSNCDGPMGHALHRNHLFVDYVVRGEGEHAFPALLAHLEQGTPPVDVPGLCWWDGEVSRANEESRRTVPPADIPRPDYDAWVAEFEASALTQYTEPRLVVEGARGCWWGEKHHCTFCGLNGSSMTFRAKSGRQLWDEIAYLVDRHRILDIVTVDNIMDMAYFKDFLPLAAECGWDLRMHFEIKSNVSAEQLALLGRAGAVHLQPGIESLNNRVLDLMDKGVSGARNVRTLRECENYALTCSWNYLYGFPGENDRDYTNVIDQFPALVHLQPPGGASRICLERFSPNFTDPRLGFTDRRPREMYWHIYELPEEELADISYMFDTPPVGISGAVEDQLTAAVAEWQTHHHDSRLLLEEDGGALLVHDQRYGWPRRTHRLTGWQAAALRELEQGRTLPALHRLLDGPALAEVEAWVTHACALGLLFRDGTSYVSLPTWGAPVRIGAGPHDYGRFYYRRGPGFVIVKDRRDPSAVARLTIDHPDLLRTFLACQTPTSLANLDPTAREALSVLAREDIVRIENGVATTIPARLQAWPVPESAI